MPVHCSEPYDDQNVFARILRGEIPARRVREDENSLAFDDIAPIAPTHILVIPKGCYVSLADFTANATDAEIAGFFRTVGAVARDLGLEADGYRVLINTGHDSGQEVPHLHAHIFAGRAMGPMLTSAT